MLKLKDWLHWVWPTLTPLSLGQQAEDVEWKQGIAASVKAGDWSTDSDVVLDESRRLFDAEVDRRKGADAKAGIYLAAITTLTCPSLTAAHSVERQVEQMARLHWSRPVRIGSGLSATRRGVGIQNVESRRVRSAWPRRASQYL